MIDLFKKNTKLILILICIILLTTTVFFGVEYYKYQDTINSINLRFGNKFNISSYCYDYVRSIKNGENQSEQFKHLNSIMNQVANTIQLYYFLEKENLLFQRDEVENFLKALKQYTFVLADKYADERYDEIDFEQCMLDVDEVFQLMYSTEFADEKETYIDKFCFLLNNKAKDFFREENGIYDIYLNQLNGEDTD